MNEKIIYCTCGNKLEIVRYDSNSMLNRDQFDAIRAGDYYCDKCTSEKSNTGYKYYWEETLPSVTDVIATLTTQVVELKEERDRLDQLNKLRSKMIDICGEYMTCVATFSNPDRVKVLQSEMRQLQPQFEALTQKKGT